MLQRFVLGMTCKCDVWEENYERSGGASTAGTHDSWGIEKSKDQRCWRYGQREMR